MGAESRALRVCPGVADQVKIEASGHIFLLLNMYIVISQKGTLVYTPGVAYIAKEAKQQTWRRDEMRSVQVWGRTR